MDVSGITTLVDTATREPLGIVPIHSSDPQLTIEPTEWERLLQGIGYTLPIVAPALGTAAGREHSSWAEAYKRLQPAWNHLRHGEDYPSLNACLSNLESLVSAPYDRARWIKQLANMPPQKAEAIADLLSGLATYCNRIGHHRDRTERDTGGDLVQMPLEHWEADLALGAAQFLLTYALRLRSSGFLVDAKPGSAKALTS